MMLGKVDAVVVDSVRTRVTDAVAPILDAFSEPAATVSDLVEEAQSLAALRTENSRLRSEVAALTQFRDAAYQLEAENSRLRALMNYRPSITHAYITGRVIADNSGTFARSVAVNLGHRHGVEDGQAVLGANGLVGRIVQAGDRSARVLLITDLNARIPVLVSRSRDHAVLGGDNTDAPRLFHLAGDHDVRPGDRVTTSGYGGMFPPGVPVGTVTTVRDNFVQIEPFEDLTRLEFVRVVDFSAFIEGSMTAVPQPPR